MGIHAAKCPTLSSRTDLIDRRNFGNCGVIFDKLTDFAEALPDYEAIGGLDLGTKTIGVSVSYHMRSIASTALPRALPMPTM